jgi:hypothetical protein
VVAWALRFQVGDDTFDAPQGTIVCAARPSPADCPRRGGGTIVPAIGATAGQPYEADGWLSSGGRSTNLYQAGDYAA